MAKESEPRRTTATGVRAIVFDQDASNNILINLDTEGFPDDQGDARATEAWIAAFELNNGLDEWLGRTFRSGLCPLLWREQLTVFSVHR